MDASSTFAPDGSVRSFERLGSFVAGNSWYDGAIHLIRSQQFDPVKEFTACSWWSCTSGWAPQSEQADRSVGPGWQGRMSARRGRCIALEQIYHVGSRHSSVNACHSVCFSMQFLKCSDRSDPSRLPEHIRGVIRVQRVGVLTVEELVWLDRRHVQVQRGLGRKKMGDRNSDPSL